MKKYASPFHATHDEAAANKMVVKLDAAIMLRRVVEENGWTQAECAVRLGISQPRVSDLLNGKIKKFTVDAMLDMLETLGYKTAFKDQSIESSEVKIAKIQVSKICEPA